MTNEEAIELLELAKSEVEWEYPIDYSVALDTAIESLKMTDILKFDKNNSSSYYTNSHCKNCSNNPANGGSGICHCILGTQVTY